VVLHLHPLQVIVGIVKVVVVVVVAAQEVVLPEATTVISL
jgi:hypothetical protein